jgi:hypothetical protein
MAYGLQLGINPDLSSLDIDCYNVWDLGNGIISRVLGPFCSGKSFDNGAAHALFSADGTRLYIFTLTGERLDIYVGPTHASDKWNWATSDNISAVTHIFIDEAGHISSRNEDQGSGHRSKMMEQLLRETASGDPVAIQIEEILTRFCDGDRCP